MEDAAARRQAPVSPRSSETLSVLPPARAFADAPTWRLDAWLVKKGHVVHHKQRIALLTSVRGTASYHVLAPASGTLLEIVKAAGSMIDTCETSLARMAPCLHSVVFNGVCALCGEEEQAHFSKTPQEEYRVPVAYSASLSITQTEAESVASVVARRLFDSKKLSLVLDLDHTLVHATDDPRAAAILQHSAKNVDLSSVASFSLPSSRAGFRPPDIMHLKLRPNLATFLERVAVKFHLHIYTMGSRPYADRVARLIDPDSRFFGGRITSREDFPEGKCNQKNIERLFPCDDSMALIVDDREDVWITSAGQSYMPNLIRAFPYHFWAGMHEAYDRGAPMVATSDAEPSSKKSRPPPLPKPIPYSNGISARVKHGQEESGSLDAKAAHGMSKSGSNSKARLNEKRAVATTAPLSAVRLEARDPESTPPASKENETERSSGHVNKHDRNGCSNSRDVPSSKALPHETKENRPVARENRPVHSIVVHENAIGEKLSDSAALSTKLRRTVKGWWDSDASPKSKNHLLRLAQVLEDCHTEFFRRCDVVASRTGRGKKSTEKKFQSPVDVKNVLADLRVKVLAGCILTFSGMKQKGEAPETVPEWNLALRLGATCSMDFVNGRTTHVVTSVDRPPNTQKCMEAMQFGTAFVVTSNWVEDTALNFERQNELTYCQNAKRRFTNGEEFRSFVETRYKEAARALKKRAREELDDISSKEVRGVTPPNKRRKLEPDVVPMKGLGPVEANEYAGPVIVLSHDEIGAAMDDVFDEL